MAEYTQTYWNNLLDQYRNGSISEKDRFALEKQALDDPFLFDALEGFTLYENATETPKEERKKTSIFSFSYMAAAASVIFLGIAIYNLLPNGNQNNPQSNRESIAMAVEDEESQTNGQINGLFQVEESEVSDVEKDSSPRSTTGHQSNIEKAKHQVESELEEVQEEVIVQEDEPEQVEAPATIPTSDRAPVREENIVFTNENGKDKNEDDAVFDRVIVLDETESNPENTAGGMKKEIVLASTTSEKMEADVMDSDIVAVVDSNSFKPAKKKKRSQSGELKSFEAVPVIGKEIFDDYAKTRIDERGLRQENPQDVTIEFSIDANGNVSNFHHIFTGCSECGPFAISLLQNSGEWKTVPPGFTGKVRYTFKF